MQKTANSSKGGEVAEGLVLVVRAGWAREPERRSLLIPPHEFRR